MNSELIEKNYKKIKINNTISSKKIEIAIQKKLNSLKKTISINGFRKGKAPNKLIEKNFRNDVLNIVLKKFIKKHLKNTIKEKKFLKNYNVQYIFNKYQKGNNFNYTLKFHIVSNKLLNKFKLIKLKKLKIKIKKSDVLKTILNFQKNITPWIEKNNSIKKNDKIYIKYKIFSKDKKILLKKNNFPILINKNFLLKNIFKKILKKKKNDQLKTKIKFSQYHPEKKIAGKKIILNIKIKKIQRKKIKKINFKKIKKFGIQENNLKELKKNIYKILKKESKKISLEYLKNQFIKKWTKKYKKKISKITLEQEIKILNQQNLLQYLKNKDIFNKIYNKNAKKICKVKIIIQDLIYKIITQESFSISNKIIKKIFQKTKKNFQNKNIKKEKIIQNIKNYLLLEKTFNFIFKNISLKNKKINFFKALKKIH